MVIKNKDPENTDLRENLRPKKCPFPLRLQSYNIVLF